MLPAPRVQPCKDIAPPDRPPQVGCSIIFMFPSIHAHAMTSHLLIGLLRWGAHFHVLINVPIQIVLTELRGDLGIGVEGKSRPFDGNRGL